MIEVDGLMAAVMPTPNASPSADAPAEFAAAMAVVQGETGKGGAQPGAEKQLVGDPVDAEPSEDAVVQLASSPIAGADPLLAPEVPLLEDSAPDPVLLDGREVDPSILGVLSATAVVDATTAATPGPTGPDVVLNAESVPEIGTVVGSSGAGLSRVPAEATTPGALGGVDVSLSAESATSVPAAMPLATTVPTGDVEVAGVALSAPVVDEAAVTPPPGQPTVTTDALATPVTTRPEVAVVAATTTNDVAATTTNGDVAGATLEGAESGSVAVAASVDPAESTAVGPVVESPDTPAGVTAPLTDTVADAGTEVDAGLAVEADVEAPASPADGVAADAATTKPIAHTAKPGAAPSGDAPAPAAPPAAVAAPVAKAAPMPATPADAASYVPTADVSPTQQVAEALRDVRRLADGSHRLSLQLHPEELGAVQLEVAVRDGRLHVRAVAETEAVRAALQHNLPELRSELRSAGVAAGSLEVGPDASGRDRPDSPNREPLPDRRPTPGPSARPTTTPTQSTISGLDIRL